MRSFFSGSHSKVTLCTHIYNFFPKNLYPSRDGLTSLGKTLFRLESFAICVRKLKDETFVPLAPLFIFFLHFSGTFLDPPCENKKVGHKRNFLFIKFIAYIDRCRIVSIFTNYSGMKKIKASNKKGKKMGMAQ